MKTIRMFVVAFIAMLLGTSFCNPVVAQSYDDIMAESIKSYMAESESELRDAGILSYDVRIQGSGRDIYVWIEFLDCNLVSSRLQELADRCRDDTFTE